MATLDTFTSASDVAINTYNAAYVMLYGTSENLRVGTAGRVYSTLENGNPKVRLIDINPSSGDFILTLVHDYVDTRSARLRVRWCANATDEESHELLCQSDTSMACRTLDSAGSVVTTHATGNWDRTVPLTIIVERTGDSFTVKVNGSTFSTFSSSALANGIVVYGYSVYSVAGNVNRGMQLTSISSADPDEITPGVLSTTSISSTSVGLSTTASTGGDGSTLNYQLQRSDDDGSPSWSNIGSSGTSTTFTDSTVAGGTDYLYRVETTDGTNTALSNEVSVTAKNTTTFDGNETGVAFLGRQSDASGRRTLVFGEVWLRVHGDSLKFWYTSTGANPLLVSVDGGTEYTPASTAIANVGSTETLSGEILSNGEADDWHDVRLRVKDGSFSAFAIRLTDGIIVSSVGTPQINYHSDYGTHEYVRGTHAGLYWEDTLLDSDSFGAYTPKYPTARGHASTFAPCNNAYVDFLVDSTTTKIYAAVRCDSKRMSVWVSEDADLVPVRQYVTATPANTNGAIQHVGPLTIPGTGTRRVRISNVLACDSIVTDGAFVTTAVPQHTKFAAWMGDSYTSGDSNTVGTSPVTETETDASGNWDHLAGLIVGSGSIATYNRARAGSYTGPLGVGSSDEWIYGTRVQDSLALIGSSLDVVFTQHGINDAARLTSDLVQLTADTVTYLNLLLTHAPNADIVVFPLMPYYGEPARTNHINMLTSAIATVNDPRVSLYDANWAFGSGLGVHHPKDVAKAQITGFGVGVLRIAAQPSDGDTLTINGDVFEFDSNASATGIAVTIGATLADTINNLGDAITAQNASYKLLERMLFPAVDAHVGDESYQGIAVRGCTSISESGTDLYAFLNAEGYADVLDAQFADVGGYRNMMLLGVG